jgi:hypothetical protein
MGTGQGAPVARWPATLKASGKLVLLGRLGEMQKAVEPRRFSRQTLGPFDRRKNFLVPHKNITISSKCIDLDISV